MKITKKQFFGAGLTLIGIVLCLGAIFIENMLAIPGFIILIAGLLLWNPGGIMENLYPPLR